MKRLFLSVVLLSVTLIQAQGGSGNLFSVHGFVDFSAETYFLDDHSLHRPNLNNNLDLRLDHLNLYFDFHPNSNIRSLAELRFLSMPPYYGKRYAWYMNTYINNSLFSTDTMTTDSLKYNFTFNDPSNGSNYKRSWVAIERAWFQYNIITQLNIRIGKFITPVGIWNVDHGSPVIVTVLQPYQASITPIFPISQLGFMANGIIFLNDFDIDYSAYLSSGRNGYKIAEAREVAFGANVGIKMPYLDGIEFGVSGFTGQYVPRAYSSTTEIRMNNPSDFGAFNQFYDPENTDITEVKLADAREICLGFDLMVPFKGAKYQTELNYQKWRNDKLVTVNDIDRITELLGFYHLLAYKLRLTKNITLEPYAMIEYIGCFNSPANPYAWFTNDPQTGEQLIDNFVTYLGGINFGLFTYSHIKLEYSFVDAKMLNGYKDYQYAWDAASFRAQFSLAF